MIEFEGKTRSTTRFIQKMRQSTYMMSGSRNAGQSVAGGKRAMAGPKHSKARASADTVCQKCQGVLSLSISLSLTDIYIQHHVFSYRQRTFHL